VWQHACEITKIRFNPEYIQKIFSIVSSIEIYEPVTLARQNTPPEDGSLRTETCWSLMNFIKNF